METIVWDDPPENRRHRWMQEFVDACRANPGRWAKVISPNMNPGDEVNVATKRYLHDRYGLEVRMTSRRPDGSRLTPGVYMMWARYPADT